MFLFYCDRKKKSFFLCLLCFCFIKVAIQILSVSCSFLLSVETENIWDGGLGKHHDHDLFIKHT